MFTPEMLDLLIETFADGNQRKFAEMLGLNNPQSITDWKKRGVNRLEHIEKIYQTFGDKLSAEWLITGNGEPFKQIASNNAQSTVVGNNVHGNGDINIMTNDAIVAQLAQKDRQIAELHAIIQNLTAPRK